MNELPTKQCESKDESNIVTVPKSLLLKLKFFSLRYMWS